MGEKVVKFFLFLSVCLSSFGALGFLLRILRTILCFECDEDNSVYLLMFYVVGAVFFLFIYRISLNKRRRFEFLTRAEPK